jgi:hypothetical protein
MFGATVLFAACKKPPHASWSAKDTAADAFEADTNIEGRVTPGPPARAGEAGGAAASPLLYDLASDLAQRRARATAELGPMAVFDVEGQVFLFAARARSAVNDAALSLARVALPAYFNGRFARAPDRAVTVYVFEASGPYGEVCARHLGVSCASDLGIYDPETREVFVDASAGVTTLTHELVHPIVHADFPDAPEWLNEGLGSLFEYPVFPRPGEIHGAKNWRYRRLLAALASAKERDTVKVDALFGMADGVFYGPPRDLHFAMVRYLCQWLDSRGWLWPFYAAWRDGVILDPTGEKAFARVTGMTPVEANGPWVEWVKRL